MTMPELRQVDFYFDLAENSQVAQQKFCLVNKDGDGFYMASPFFRCRDYIMDSMASKKLNRDFEVYGWETENVDWEQQFIVSTYRSMEDGLLKKNIEHMDKALEKAGLPLIPFIPIKFATSTWGKSYAVSIDPWYSEALVRMSILTGLLRCVWYQDFSNPCSDYELWDEDWWYRNSAEGSALKILTDPDIWSCVRVPLKAKVTNCLCLTAKQLKSVMDGYEEEEFASMVHDNTGVNELLAQIKYRTKVGTSISNGAEMSGYMNTKIIIAATNASIKQKEKVT